MRTVGDAIDIIKNKKRGYWFAVYVLTSFVVVCGLMLYIIIGITIKILTGYQIPSF